MDFRKAEVTRSQTPVELSALEFQLLQVLHREPRRDSDRDELLNRVWGYDAAIHSRTVDVHVAWLRQKIEPNPARPQYVVTVHKLGYRFLG